MKLLFIVQEFIEEDDLPAENFEMPADLKEFYEEYQYIMEGSGLYEYYQDY